MVGKTAPIREHDAKRMETIALYCGCLPCLFSGILDVHATIEHVTDAGRRVGKAEQHQKTIGLCRWHHFGDTFGLHPQVISGERGPSLAWGRRTFEEHYGDEVQVLIPTQDFMLDLFAASPWVEYSVPRDVARRVRHHWIDLRHANTSQFKGR